MLYYLDGSGQRHAVQSEKDWRRRRRHILENMQKVMGRLPARRGIVRVEQLEEINEGPYLRRRIRYEAEPGDWVPAWLLAPPGKGRHPAVLCLHQTVRIGKDEPVGLGGRANLRYAKELAERGYVALAPDYPTFGDYKIDVYAKGYSSATMKGIFNHMRAVDVLQKLSGVDPKRIGVCGHSLGGHNSLFLAAFDSRVSAVVTSCGFTSFPKYYRGNLTGWSHKGYMPRIAEIYNRSPEKMPFDFPEILGAIAPRAIFINAPSRDDNFEVTGVEDCVRSAGAVYEKIYHRPEALVVEYPEAAHDFPPEVRTRAYAFLDRRLNVAAAR
ncbi:MAG: alpha/beta fold hydrolase [Acidobacteria bacterium]|nr:alpha/beta fold hydrolase [Acidobacteriota bacterium]